MLEADAVLAAGMLSKLDQETMKLAVSTAVGCDYCEAANSLLGKLASLKPEIVRRIRAGQPTVDGKRGALVHFVQYLVQTVNDEEFSAIKNAGYTDVDISLGLAAITFTNVFNASTTPRSTSRSRLTSACLREPRTGAPSQRE
jgi:alkylhydroperoxidase family enzyme